MTRLTLPILLAAGLLALTSGCASTNPGDPQPSTTDQASTTTTTPPVSTPPEPDGAPTIAQPLDASRLVTHVCSSLTPHQFVALHIDRPHGERDANPSDPGCAWRSNHLDYNVSVIWMKSNPVGLDSVYQAKPTLAYFEQTAASGYPAVVASVSDLRSQGTCVLSVGINAHLYFLVTYGSLNDDDKPQSCARAKQAATDVITNLRKVQ